MSGPEATRLLPGAYSHSVLEAEPEPFVLAQHPRHSVERLMEHFSEQLNEENRRSLAPIEHEVQVYRINSVPGLPVDRDVMMNSQLFIDGYLRRRGPRAVYSALVSVSKRTPLVEEVYRDLLAFRDRYFSLSLSYGGYGKETLKEEADESVSELADRNEERLVLPDETIEEELVRRRMRAKGKIFNPFKKGRFSLRASTMGFGDWIELVWTTPNIQIKAAPGRMRCRMGGTLGGFDFSSYATVRWRGRKGRSGFEVIRRIDENTRLRLAAGINFGREEDPDSDLVDVMSLTSDSRYVYLSLERSF